MALMYVTIRAADCDSPAAMSRLGWSPCKGSTPLPPRNARATWVNMSYE